MEENEKENLEEILDEIEEKKEEVKEIEEEAEQKEEEIKEDLQNDDEEEAKDDSEDLQNKLEMAELRIEQLNKLNARLVNGIKKLRVPKEKEADSVEEIIQHPISWLDRLFADKNGVI